MNITKVPAIDRNRFLQALANQLRLSRTARHGTGLFVIDIKQFRRINLSFGFPCGDHALAELDARLRKIVIKPDCVFRIGNNEFAVIIPMLQNESFLQLIARQLLHLFDDNITWYDKQFRLDAHIGAAASTDSECSNFLLLAATESALAQAKLEGVVYVQKPLHDDAPSGHDWEFENAAMKALDDNEFTLFWQPKIRVKDRVPQNAEGLLRWRSESFGLATPDRLLPPLEYNGKMLELTKFVLHCALRQQAKWRQAGNHIGVAVNVPANIVHHRLTHDMVADAIKIWGIAPSLLTLEITESAVIVDQESSFMHLQALRDIGVRISIDDFGTGYSSLQYFKHIPADELKIDKSFVTALAKDEADQNIVRHIIQLAHSFKLDVVAEGVEDAGALLILEQLGCDYAQGYHIARPLSDDAFIDWLGKSNPA